jgi:Beta-lactamase
MAWQMWKIMFLILRKQNIESAQSLKGFTATAILQLQEQGALSVQDTIDRYHPGFLNGKHINSSGIYFRRISLLHVFLLISKIMVTDGPLNRLGLVVKSRVV